MNNDLISRSELINDLETYFKSGVEGIDSTTLFKQILLDIDNAPTVEPFCSYLSDGEMKQPCVEGPCNHERPHGEWMKLSNMSKRSYRRVCSQCHNISYFCGDGNYPNCPYCLADMREADNDD